MVALVVGAGPGSRLGHDQPKAFVELAGAPLLIHSLRAMLAAPAVTRAVVVIPQGTEVLARQLLDRHGPWRCPLEIVPGGAERQDSVRHGLAAAGDTDLIAIHDAARPLVAPAVVAAAIESAALHGAAIVATPATDTMKQVDADARIEHTPARERLWHAQTPQVFRTALIRAAHAQAPSGAAPATDDAALVERLGAPVYVVPGNAENRKITTAADLRWAEWVLCDRRAPR